MAKDRVALETLVRRVSGSFANILWILCLIKHGSLGLPEVHHRLRRTYYSSTYACIPDKYPGRNVSFKASSR